MQKINVMISSRNADELDYNGIKVPLSTVRKALKVELEEAQLFGEQVFEVWINEDAPPAEGTEDGWSECMRQVRSADILLVIYNGNSGWAKYGGEVGICHGELHTALTTQPAKVRIVRLNPLVPATAVLDKDIRFRKYVDDLNRFYSQANDGVGLIQACKKALFSAVVGMVGLGVREARKGQYSTGEALDWSRMDFRGRYEEMVRVMHDALLDRTGSMDGASAEQVYIKMADEQILVCCHAVPAAMTVGAAREMVGQPFLKDHEVLAPGAISGVGPIHFVACHRNITENQAMNMLGFPDATVVSAPFGVYIADNVQKIQMILIANCRDETCTRTGVQRAMEWLEQSGEDQHLARRAVSRTRIINAIADELDSV